MRVCISYRREESTHVTGRIYDRLVIRFGSENVFKDVDSIPLGSDYRQKIQEAIGQCNALLVVLGDHWLNLAGASGRRRLDNEGDFVRIEIEAALQRNIPIIPLLVGKNAMPRAEDLPGSIRDLAFRQGTAVRPDPDFHRDVDRVIHILERSPDGLASPQPKNPTELANSIGVRLVLVQPGRFLMGSPAEEGGKEDEQPRHGVQITRQYYLGVAPVTQEQYRQVAHQNPSRLKEPQNPVESVSWFESIEFCNCLSSREGLNPCYAIDGRDVELLNGDGYRLPTEAEWEYACRAGSETSFCFGNVRSHLDEYGWHWANAGGRPRHTCQKLANGWGLCDMHGNVWEWCWDYYGPYEAEAQTDPWGSPQGTLRVIRGGSFNNYAIACRSAIRFRLSPDSRNHDTGFRLLRCIPQAPRTG